MVAISHSLDELDLQINYYITLLYICSFSCATGYINCGGCVLSQRRFKANDATRWPMNL